MFYGKLFAILQLAQISAAHGSVYSYVINGTRYKGLVLTIMHQLLRREVHIPNTSVTRKIPMVE